MNCGRIEEGAGRGVVYHLRVEPGAGRTASSSEAWRAIFGHGGGEGSGHSSSEENNSTGRKPSAKAKEVLRVTVDEYVKRHDRRAVHFVTLTVPDSLHDERELSRRVNSIRDEVLKRYHGGLRVYERHKSGVVHVHLVLVYRRPGGLRSCRWMKIGKRQTLEAAGPGWLELWEWWREVARSYSFGRVECLPVRKPERAGNYCAKYLGKGEYTWQKGTRVYAVWKLRVLSQRQFSFSGGKAQAHRKFMRWLTGVGGVVADEEAALARMKELWGSTWMRVVWWHVKEGWAEKLLAQYVGILGVTDEARQLRARRDEEAAWRAFGKGDEPATGCESKPARAAFFVAEDSTPLRALLGLL